LGDFVIEQLKSARRKLPNYEITQLRNSSHRHAALLGFFL